ncbi:hypothetical protein K3495_g9724 [Podosphaera aphanis]|nr:hypothetical protein K3495_g9724 [Podosphaera aphanis]
MAMRKTPVVLITNSGITSPPAEQDGRRRSRRTIRPPQKFDPIPKSPSRSTIAKRKRISEEDQDDSTDIEENSSDTAQESADETTKTRRRKGKQTRKPVSKKPKLDGQFTLRVAQHTKLVSRPRKKTGRKVAIADEAAGGLYAEVFLSEKSSQEVALKWLEQYHENNQQALTDLVNLVLRSSGCGIEVTVDDVDDVDNIDGRLENVQNEFQTQNITEYPLITKLKISQNFRSNLTNFFDQLIQIMHQNGALYEETALIENIHQWIATMSSSTTRPFRHTATLVALTMTTARCRIAHAEIETAAKVQRQLENESKNKRPNKARLTDFKSRVEASNAKKAIIIGQIQDYFDTVYVHRYRDIDPKIRTECVEALGTWILSLESYFFDGQYLRYMGWMLSDIHGPTRQEVVLQLQKIMKTLNHGGIRHFIDRFRPRLVEMATRDSETIVRAYTIELITLIRNAEMLEPDDIDNIGKLIFDAEPRVRKSVVDFFIANIENLYETRLQEIYGDEVPDENSEVLDEEDYNTPRLIWIKFKCLAEILVTYDSQDEVELSHQADSRFLRASGTDSRFTLVTQSLFNKMSELKKWETLAGYLLYDHSLEAKACDNETDRLLREAVKPTEKEEIVLLEILRAVVKPCFHLIEESVKGDRKKQAKADMLEARETAVLHLASLIARLLKKYGADPQAIVNILRLSHLLNLGGFHDLRQNSVICSKLLDGICTQFRSHADSEVLKESCISLLHAREYDELEEITNSKIQLLWEEVISHLQKINEGANDISRRGDSLSEKFLSELSHNLARIEQLSSISNPIEFIEGSSDKINPAPITLILDIIARGELQEGNEATSDFLEDTVVQSAMRSALFYFMWKSRDLASSAHNENDVNEVEIKQFIERQEIFITNIIASFSSRAEIDEIRLLGAGTLLDLHVTFAATLGSKDKFNDKSKAEEASKASNINLPDYLQPLIKDIHEDVKQELTLLFSQLERQFAKKSKKRLNAPGDDEAPEDLDSEGEEEETDEMSDIERQAEILSAEEQLCLFTGKLVLAILAEVIDFSGLSKGKLRSRLLRNKNLLGPNFKEIVGCLDESKLLSKKNQKVINEDDAPKKATEIIEAVGHDDEDEDMDEERDEIMDTHRGEDRDDADIDEDDPFAEEVRSHSHEKEDSGEPPEGDESGDIE